jgi:hypothetical protein
LAFSERLALEFISNRVRFTIDMQFAARMRPFWLPLLLFGQATQAVVLLPEFVHEHDAETALTGEDTRFVKEGRLNAYRKPADPQAARCAGKAQ